MKCPECGLEFSEAEWSARHVEGDAVETMVDQMGGTQALRWVAISPYEARGDMLLGDDSVWCPGEECGAQICAWTGELQ